MYPLLATTLHLQLCQSSIYLPITLLLHFGAEKCHLFPFFSLTIGSRVFFCHLNLLSFVFSNTLQHIQALGSCSFLLEVLILLIQLIFYRFLVSMAAKGSSSTLPGVILTPNEYKEYLHLTQAAKYASISSIAQIGNTSACLSHSSGLWILDSEASDHLSRKKDIFSSLTFTSPLPMVTLTNGSQTIAKGIGSACPLPSLPLTSVLYIHDSPFN